MLWNMHRRKDSEGRNAMKHILKPLVLAIHKLLTRVGIHVLPVHYYSSVPNIVELEKTQDRWAFKSGMPGVDSSLDRQVNRLGEICSPFQKEYAGNSFYQEGVRNAWGLGYGYIEAQALHAVLRYYKSERVIEVGSGVSTYCILAALAMNKDQSGKAASFVSIEPYPSFQLRSEEAVRLIMRPVQQVPFDEFQRLQSGDLLFIDSSHAVKTGSDVNYLILEVLPRLNRGVIVHLHDIYFPYDYQRDVLDTVFHWSETSLLRAFLIHNSRVEIIFCLSQLHYDRPNALREVFPEYDPQPAESGIVRRHAAAGGHFPAAIYLRM